MTHSMLRFHTSSFISKKLFLTGLMTMTCLQLSHTTVQCMESTQLDQERLLQNVILRELNLFRDQNRHKVGGEASRYHFDASSLSGKITAEMLLKLIFDEEIKNYNISSDDGKELTRRANAMLAIATSSEALTWFVIMEKHRLLNKYRTQNPYGVEEVEYFNGRRIEWLEKRGSNASSS